MVRWVTLLGLVALSAGSASAGNLTNDFSANSYAAPCSPGTINLSGFGCTADAGLPAASLPSFGSVSAGGFNYTDGSGFAQLNWFHSGFGIYAAAATNTTAGNQAGGGQAYGSFLESVEVQPLPDHPQGELGTMLLSYHLNGSVDIDWGGPQNQGNAFVQFVWFVVSFNVDCFQVPGTCDDSLHQDFFNQTWHDDHISTTINQDVTLPILFHYGEPLYISETAQLTAAIGNLSYSGAEVGHATADFLHTATMKPVIVQDQSGHVVPNAVILSDTGFDYTNPAAPEPGSALLVLSGFATVLLVRSRR
jgi:hypothetical protein